MSNTSRIINSRYPGQTAGLPAAEGPVIATFIHRDWVIVYHGNNKFTIQNALTGTYASAPDEFEAAPVLGSPKPYTWQQLTLPGGWHQIATTDGKYVWFLTGPEDGAQIILRGVSYRGNDSQWAYEPAPDVK